MKFILCANKLTLERAEQQDLVYSELENPDFSRPRLLYLTHPLGLS